MHDEQEVLIKTTRSGQVAMVRPNEFENFFFEHGDALEVLPGPDEVNRPVTWSDTNIKISEGHALRVPPVWEIFRFKGFSIPEHLIALTGAGSETLDSIGQSHIESYQKHIGIEPDMTVIDLGCGIGRDAFQLFDVLSGKGKYIGVDVTRDSIAWATKNITPFRPNYTFHHVDAFSELYNPHGAKTTKDIVLPASHKSVDRIFLSSVFTHLLTDEVAHYLREFFRVLAPGGKVYASFFWRTPEAIASSKAHNTYWKFDQDYGNGCFGNDPMYRRGATAYTDAAMRKLIADAGLVLEKPFLLGAWSKLPNAEAGQDIAILSASEAPTRRSFWQIRS